MENFEQQTNTFPEKPQPPNEALSKIEKSLKRAEECKIYDDYIEMFYPELFKEERQKFKEKWKEVPSIDLDLVPATEVQNTLGGGPAISIADTTAEEYWQDNLELNKKFGEFIRQRSPQEILARVQETYVQYLGKKSETSPGEDIRNNFYKACEIGRRFLTKQEMKKASQECLNFLWQKVETVKDKKERFSLSAMIFNLPLWFREVKPKLNFEQRGKLLAYLIASGSLSNEERAKVFSTLVVYRKIKPKTSEEKGKKTIVGLNFIRESARKEIGDLVDRGEKEGAVNFANFLEKRNSRIVSRPIYWIRGGVITTVSKTVTGRVFIRRFSPVNYFCH